MSRDQCCCLVNTIVGCGPHACCRSTHSSTKELKEMHVTPFEDIVFHHQPHCIFHCVNRVVRWKRARETVDPAANDSEGMVSIDIGIHRVSVGGKQLCIRREQSDCFQFCQKLVAILQIRGNKLSEFLELKIDSLAKVVQ